MGKYAPANMTDKLFRIKNQQEQTAATPSDPSKHLQNGERGGIG